VSTSLTFLSVLTPKPKEQTRIKCLSFIVLLCVCVAVIDVAYALPGNSSYDDFNGLSTDSLYLSHENLSPREVTGWRDHLPGISSVPSNLECTFRYEAVFFPDIPPDAELAGYYARVLPDGVAVSYAEVTDRATPAPDGFPARAEDWISGGEACAVRERLRDVAGLSDEYVEVARHTTVRVSPGVGQTTATTALYQHSNDGDPGHEYFCLGSYIAMTPEDGWRNSGFCVSYDLDAAYYSLKPFGGFFGQSNPQTSPRYPAPPGDVVGKLLNAFDIFGVFSRLFGHPVGFHAHDTTGVAWTTGCGYFSPGATGSLNLTPVSQIVGIQPAADDIAWHVLAGIKIDTKPGFSRPGEQPASSFPWGHLVFIRKATGAA
jgi:hypothetical protein